MRILSRLLIFFACCIAALAVLVAGIALATAFPSGRAAIASLASTIVSSVADIDLEIDGVDRLTPVAIDIRHIGVGMGGRRIAAVDGLHLRLQWSDLLRARFRPTLVHVEQLALEALPPEGGESSGTGGFQIGLPLLPAEAIRIDRLVLAEAVLGESAELHIAARESKRDDGHVIEADIQRLDRPGDGLVLRARYRAEAETLDIRADATEAPGGLLARQVGAAPDAAFRAELAGAGPITMWRGRLQASLDGVAAIAADLGIDGDVGAIVGSARIEPDLMPGLAPLLREPINYRARLRWPESDVLRIDASEIRIAQSALGVTGVVATDFSNVQLQLNGDLQLAMFAPIAGAPMDGSVGLLLHVAGSPDRPAVAGDVTLHEPRFDTFGASNAQLRLEARPDRSGRYRISLDGHATGIIGLPASIAPLLVGRIDLDTAFDASPTGDEIRVGKLALRGSSVSLEGEGVVRPGAGESRARLSLRAELPPGDGPVTGGKATAELAAAGEIATGSFAGEGWLQLDGLVLADAALGRLIGPAPRLAAKAVAAAGAPVRIEESSLQLAAGEVAATGTFDVAGDNLALDVTGRVPDLNRLSDLAGQALSGRAELAAHVSGPSGDPGARGKLTVAELKVAARRVERGELTFDLRRLVSEPQGPLAAAIRSEGADYRLATEMRFRKQAELDLAKLTAAAPGLTGSGDLTLDIVRLLGRGRLTIDATDLAPAAALAGIPLAGRGQVAARLDAANGKQQVMADIRGEGLRFADVTLGMLEGRAKLDDTLGKPRGDISLSGRDVVTEGVTLRRWQAAVQGDLARANFDLSLDGEASGAISARAAGTAGLDGAAWRVGLRSFDGRHGEIALKLDRPTELRGGAGAIRLAPTDMTVGGAKLNLAGGMANGQVDGYLRSGALPLNLLRSMQPDMPLRGNVEVDISASGPAAEPRIAAKLRSSDLRLRRTDTTVAFDLDLTLSNGRVAGRANVANLADRPLVATVAVPMRLSLAPWRLDWSPDGPIEGRLDGPLDLGRVLPPFVPEGDTVSGVAQVQIALAGTMARPAASGTVKMTGGRYENAVAEAGLRDLAIDVTGNGDAVRLAGRGTDGDGGTVTLDGNVNLRSSDQPVAGTLALRNFWVARRADAAVRMAGDINLAGTAAAPRLAGKLTIQQADLYLPDQLPPEVVKLDVVEVNRPAHLRPLRAAAASGESSGGLKIGLDVQINADRRVFVRGRGLESEWRGDVRVRGDTAAPDIAGTLEAINGHIDFVGQRFVLTKGKLLFPGGTQIDPDLDVATELSRGDITAILSVTGTMTTPKLTLGARPDMPPEEVISRIMFQRGTARLSPLQAIQVAQSVLTLTGQGGGGPSIVDRLRRKAGLDVIDFEGGKTEDEAGSVSVGKYVSDRVLLRAEKGFDATGPRAGVEVEVLPNLSVESKVGTNASTSLGVKLKKDY